MDGFTKLHELYDNPSNVLFEEENFLDYRPGGFHPVALGDTLKDGRLEQWVSVKIANAERTNRSRELQVLRALAQYSNVNPGSEHIVQLLDDFLHEGPNGCHQCLVFELLGPTCQHNVSTQMLEAVAFMHEAGYAHGDLSIKNLAFYNDRLSRLSEEELFEALGTPNPEELTRLDGKPLGQGIPTQLVESALWTGWPLDDDEDDENVRIIDLGEAFNQTAVPKNLAQPGGLQAPESIFTGKIDYKQDLWRAGLVIYYLIFGALPYSWWGINPLVEAMIDVFGELPPEWESKWEQMRSDAVARGDPGAGKWKQLPDWRLERQFDKHVHEPELKAFLPVIQGTHNDGNANTYPATYHQGTATLQLYAHHLTASKAPGGPPKCHMTQLKAYAMTSDKEIFVRGAAVYRNNRDRAKTNQDDFIDHANRVARCALADTPSTTFTNSGTSLSVLYAIQSTFTGLN
ncbi:uncharacterized protein Z518_00838 [Rhinocladiella mackenziei CBS 650.93]|uniref:Rhinocladiella mackenziei CBS 650.93 unplaced genomic scaffold supercont1.1, whole genome shotgun sequence n=1 Tax=Rhinocladiella mackenziei CBS 650.93 TaxID=1442369 RepID=A0A0D2G4U6_9EURO|nr:uncharacterized protein Z518_00838 [Rhinocladiella mackenziei CBS 650.93]KIX09757.1 hypothetical protein Z518_00838 [Rhinocladiella mackenziei CBS 650.93]